MQNILVATDLSHRSHNAVERAAQLTQRHDARLTVLHVIEEYVPDDLAGKRRDATRGLLDTYVNGVEALEDAHYQTRIEFGEGWRRTVEVAEELDADLIVVGQHKTARIRDMFRGATMDLIIRHSHTPTLIVASERALDYDQVVGAIDFSDASTQALDYALKLAPGAEARAVHIKHGVDLSRLRPGGKPSAEERFQEVLAELGDRDRVTPLVEEGYPSTVLREMVDKRGRHLLAMGVHSRLGIGPMGGLTELFARMPPCDVLLLQPEK